MAYRTIYFTIYALNGDLGKLAKKSGKTKASQLLKLAEKNDMILDEATISAVVCNAALCHSCSSRRKK